MIMISTAQCDRPQCIELQRAHAAALRRLAMLETIVLSAQSRKQTEIVDVDSELTIRELTSSSSLLVSAMQMVRDLEERNACLEMKLAHRIKEDTLSTPSRSLSPRDLSSRSALDNSPSPFRPEEKNSNTRRRARRTHTPNAASLLGGTEVEFDADETESVSLRDALRKSHTHTYGTPPDSCECWNTDRTDRNTDRRPYIAPRTESPKALSPVITPSSPDSLPMSVVSQLLGGQEFENGKKHTSRVVSMRDVLRSRSLSSDSTKRRGSGPLSFRDALQIPARRPGQSSTEEDVISMRDAFRIRDPCGPTAQNTPCSHSTADSISFPDKVYVDGRNGWVHAGVDMGGKVLPSRQGIMDTHMMYGGIASPPRAPPISPARG